MGSLSLAHWIVVILIVMLLFGRGKISELMGDFAKGINSFKKGLADGDAPAPAAAPTPAAPPAQVTHAQSVTPPAEEVRR